MVFITVFTTYGFTNYSGKNVQGVKYAYKYSSWIQHIHMDYIEINLCKEMKYCLVTIDPYSKWVEAFPCAKLDSYTPQ